MDKATVLAAGYWLLAAGLERIKIILIARG
ncbi:hypothetical protein C7959_11621 [Orenia marismortui]|uniref:Uncharacterized protein n=1 Tax=Orenia marismortui TaxID=46469 RepID=A0A4R8GXX2_9FIRM|nr:hypothetical protein C7959_11621 [Orenia marismortui]